MDGGGELCASAWSGGDGHNGHRRQPCDAPPPPSPQLTSRPHAFSSFREPQGTSTWEPRASSYSTTTRRCTLCARRSSGVARNWCTAVRSPRRLALVPRRVHVALTAMGVGGGAITNGRPRTFSVNRHGACAWMRARWPAVAHGTLSHAPFGSCPGAAGPVAWPAATARTLATQGTWRLRWRAPGNLRAAAIDEVFSRWVR